jgi:hypothetical protein
MFLAALTSRPSFSPHLEHFSIRFSSGNILSPHIEHFAAVPRVSTYTTGTTDLSTNAPRQVIRKIPFQATQADLVLKENISRAAKTHGQ